MSANRVSLLIGAAAVVAIVVVLISGGATDLPSTGGDDKPAAKAPGTPAPGTPAPNSDAHSEAHAREQQRGGDPDATRGTDPYALTRPANLRRALAVLDRRRARVRGVFDGLRIAPGRIDTVIIHPDDRRTNIQVRPDFEISFETTHDFPTRAGFRKGGLTARDVDARAPARLLRAIDSRRRGSAAHDIDYILIGKDIIDFTVDVNAYMRIRTPRPRYFRLEDGRAEPFG
ncbi:MAG: hypothetical protein H0T69_08940 [Thermoleophilaceae bacterium]|nr:hypothetical protein [Thermoleophilaceae bacterium]